MSDNINSLPVPTWNRIGVNYAVNAAAMPEVPEGGWPDADVVITSVPEGVEISGDMPLACEELVSGMGEKADRLIAENANAVWNITAENAVRDPVIIEANVSADAPAVILGNIYAVAGSDLTVVCVFRGTGGVSESLIRVWAEERARVKLVEVQLLGENANHHSAVAMKEEAGAKIEVARVELGARVKVCGTQSLLEGRGSEYDLTAAYFGDNDEILDFNDTAVHTGRDTLSELHSAGVLDGSADKILRGTIDFKFGAVHAVGHESEDVLLMSPGVRNRTAPLILCAEEEVEGQHAASAGKLDEGILYYLNTRGISTEDAERLMVEAKFAPAVDAIPNESLCEEVLRELKRRLGN